MSFCSCGPFCQIPEAQAVGWPKNIGHATATHQSMMARFAQQAAQVLCLSATGDTLDTDLVVTEGHKHNTPDTLLWWRQLAAWPIVGRTLPGVVTVGQVITDTVNEDLGMYFFRVPLNSAGNRVTSILYPRFRATVPTAGAPAESLLVVTGELVRIGAFNAITTVAALPALNISAAPNQWFTWGAVEITGIATDARFGLRLRALVSVAAQQGTALEVAVGLMSGL